MLKPLVTIAIPFYNNKETIIDAVKSVFAQTYQDWELILINDGSSDESLELVSQLTDARVRIVSDGVNKGLIERLNQIPDLAQGEYLARMDADDMMSPYRIEKQVNFLLTNPDYDLVDTGAYSMNQQGEVQGVRGLDTHSYTSQSVVVRTALFHASVLGKKDWFIKHRYSKEYVRAEDHELWCRTHKTSKFGRIQEPLYIVREGKVNVKNYAKSMKCVRKIIYNYGPNVIPQTTIFKEISKTYLKEWLYYALGSINMQDFLSLRRNNSLPTSEKAKATTMLNIIGKTQLK